MSTAQFKNLCLASVASAVFSVSSVAAQQQDRTREEEFASENAIVNTSILFAIGAREAQQELRGAFGWPTFQEGLVEGVYFRFDPDGYARFSPSPRLDTDVFEVVCRPRTYSCTGRKNGLSIALTSRGLIQIRFENALATDEFFVAEGVNELQLPQSVLQPLAPRLELLLSSGGELIIKRGGAINERLSLVGFSSVASYLRWITAKQDYVVLPRDWPVPNANSDVEGLGLTQVANWQSPMPQPLFAEGVLENRQTIAPTPQQTSSIAANDDYFLQKPEQILERGQTSTDMAISPERDEIVSILKSHLVELQQIRDLLEFSLARTNVGTVNPVVSSETGFPIAKLEAATEMSSLTNTKEIQSQRKHSVDTKDDSQDAPSMSPAITVEDNPERTEKTDDEVLVALLAKLFPLEESQLLGASNLQQEESWENNYTFLNEYFKANIE